MQTKHNSEFSLQKYCDSLLLAYSYRLAYKQYKNPKTKAHTIVLQYEEIGIQNNYEFINKTEHLRLNNTCEIFKNSMYYRIKIQTKILQRKTKIN